MPISGQLKDSLGRIAVFYARLKSFSARAILKLNGNSTSDFIELISGDNFPAMNFIVLKKDSDLLHFDYEDYVDKNNLGITFASQFVIRVKDIVLDSKTGIIYSSSGAIISDSSSWPKEYLAATAQIRPGKFVRQVDQQASVERILLTSNGFYHWLIEDLPLYLRLKKYYANCETLVYENAPKYVLTFLEKMHIEYLMVPRFAKLFEYTFISRGDSVGWPNPRDIETLKELRFDIAKTEIKKSKVYISRLGDSRSPDFEKELIQNLTKSGWTVVDFNLISLIEQINLISNARVIAGVHGAGLSSIVWLPDGSKVIELGTDRFVRCFNRLASIAEVNYQRINYLNLKTEEIVEILDKA
jgi:hypothetical protein